MRIMIKPGTKNLAILGCDNNIRLNSLIKNSGWIYPQYSGYNLKYAKTYPLLYQQSWIEVPFPLLYRLSQTDLKMDWDSDAYNLYNESVLKHTKILEIKKMNMDTIISIIRDAGLDPSQFKRPLKDHQLQSLAMYLVSGNAANFGEVRTGKTPPTTIYCWWLFSTGKIDCTIWVVPNNTKYTLRKELTKDLPDYITSLTNIIEGTKANKTRLWNEDKLFYIAGYETVRADIEIVKEAFKNKRIALVLDECHRVKNNDAQQTQAIKSLEREYTVIMSGTPVANKPHDVFEPVQQMSPELLAHSAEHFKKTYAWTDSYENVTAWKSRGFGVDGNGSALDEIHNRMAVVSVRTLRKDANMELGVIIEPQFLDCPDKLAKVYEQATENFILELSSASDRSRLFISNFLARLVRLQQLTDGYLPKIDGTGKITGYVWLDESYGITNVKMQFIDQWVNDYLYNGTKLVIYSRFVPVLEKLFNRYKKRGTRLIYGNTNPKDTELYQQEFKNNPDCRIMICNTMCTEGKDFNPCEFVMFYDRVWGLKDNTQAEGRVTGINQVQESTIMPLVIKDTIDFNLETIVLPEKRKNAAKVEDGVGVEVETYTIDDLFTLLR